MRTQEEKTAIRQKNQSTVDYLRYQRQHDGNRNGAKPLNVLQPIRRLDPVEAARTGCPMWFLGRGFGKIHRRWGALKLNEKEIRKAWDLFHPNGDLAEIRVFKGKNARRGYFTDAETAIQALQKLPEGTQVYHAVQKLSADFQPPNVGVFEAGKAVKDADISNYRWLILDFDTIPAHNNSRNATDAELSHTLDICGEVTDTLCSMGYGFQRPAIIGSGNGYHAFFRIDLQNNNNSRNLLKNVLHTLDALYSDDSTEIDKTVYNPSRIIRLPGTFSYKGEQNGGRFAVIEESGDNSKINDANTLQRLSIHFEPATEATHGNTKKATF